MTDSQSEFLGRIDQLDAKLLDNEFITTLRKQVIQHSVSFENIVLPFFTFLFASSILYSACSLPLESNLTSSSDQK